MNPILELRDIVKVFGSRRTAFTAVDGVSLTVTAGESFGLVGESGSGKTTLARCAINLISPTSGTALFEGKQLSSLSAKDMRALRTGMGIVFQNPIAALNPRMSIGRLIAEPLLTHTVLRGRELVARVEALLDDVGLAVEFAGRFPHQLSGGQCQRVGIARALATTPRLLVLDEPTSALDVSVQAQILNLLRDLREQHGLSYLLISHDLDVVRYMADRVAVMHRGVIVEQGDASTVLENPAHEYTRTLLEATPGMRKSS